MDASTGFFHENMTSEGERYRLKNPVYSLIRASRTVIGSIAPVSVFEKATISES
ncbi:MULTISPECIES: hypothetical protein [unclassified Microcoleus]|uniref:hypothetical protein n=1 Tax=unclassified Microcoleus TaxID=2642155 RepID=UPI002FD51BCE